MIDTPTTEALGRFLDLTVFRHGLITANLANIDTPGYRTRDIDFRRELERASGEFVYANFSPMARPVQGLLERPDGNNVSMEREGLLLAETQLRFQAGVQLLRVEFHRLSTAINEGK
ncbi:MAG: flagellar biosynthesis protein FlgB [Acidobacteriia bacterium]|nr:flagellar biosynthesis protein FlgB [Terriglobia bacterium]